MLAYYMREAYLLLEEGASVEQIDRVLTEFGLPVGPYGMQDIAGIDVGARIRQYLASIGKSRAEGPQSAIPDRLFEMGRYGQKTGAGWYRYDAPGSRNRTTDPLIEQLANEEAQEARHHAAADRRRGDPGARSRRRWPTKARACSTRSSRRGRATSTSSTPTASASRAIAAGRCSTPTRSACRQCCRACKEYRARFGDYWEPAPLLEKLVAEGHSGLMLRRRLQRM